MSDKYQINNLTIKYNRNSGKWEVWSPPDFGRRTLLEEFEGERSAILFAQDTHDFLSERGRKRKYGR